MPVLESLFNKDAGKPTALESLLIKVVGLRASNFIKKKLQHRCFPANIATFLRTAFLYNIS